MDEQDTRDFGSRWELFLRSVFESFVAGFFQHLFAYHFFVVGFPNSMAEK
jgi:hypothetical protein